MPVKIYYFDFNKNGARKKHCANTVSHKAQEVEWPGIKTRVLVVRTEASERIIPPWRLALESKHLLSG
jgi:hypothetical protein